MYPQKCPLCFTKRSKIQPAIAAFSLSKFSQADGTQLQYVAKVFAFACKIEFRISVQKPHFQIIRDFYLFPYFRSDEKLRELFSKSSLTVIKDEVQTNFPTELYVVKM